MILLAAFNNWVRFVQTDSWPCHSVPNRIGPVTDQGPAMTAPQTGTCKRWATASTSRCIRPHQAAPQGGRRSAQRGQRRKSVNFVLRLMRIFAGWKWSILPIG
jgi:hypothetical protein